MLSNLPSTQYQGPSTTTRTFKILHVVSGFEIGGITRFVEWMVALNREGRAYHEVLLGTAAPDAVAVPEAIWRHASVHFIDPSRRTVLRSVASAWRLAKDYDALLIHTAFPVVVLPLILSRKPGLIFQHGMMPGRRSKISRLIRTWWYSLLPIALNARVVCSTPDAYRKAAGMGIRLRDSDVAIIPFGVPLSHDRCAKAGLTRTGVITVGLAGRLVRQKRHGIVLESLACYEGNTPIRLRIAGDGRLREDLEELASQIAENVEVEFLGELEDMRAFYDSIDLLLFPSRNESFGLVVPEAFNRCVPVAVFDDVGGCLSLIRDGENGFVLKDGKDGLAALWILLDRDSSILQSMSRNLEAADLSELSIEKTRERIDRLAAEMM